MLLNTTTGRGEYTWPTLIQMASSAPRQGLRRQDYNGRPLHPMAGRGVHKNTTTGQTKAKPVTADDDILAPPASSSDEESVSSKRKPSDAGFESPFQDSSPRARKKLAINRKTQQAISPSTRRSKRQLEDSKDGQEKGSESLDMREETMFSLSSSQKSRRGQTKKFGSLAHALKTDEGAKTQLSRKSKDDGFRLPPQLGEGSPKKSAQDNGFRMPRQLKEPGTEPLPSQGFKMWSMPEQDRSKDVPADRGFQEKALDIPNITDAALRSQVQEAMEATNKFRVPLQWAAPSSSSVETQVEANFSPQSRSRSSSLSSLRSMNSTMGSMEDAQSTSPRAPKCPLCEEPVPIEFFESYNNGRPLTYSDQHRFCHDHRLNSAQSQWSDRGYPTIDWQAWSKTRIAKPHTSHLLKILYDKDQKISYYARILSEHASGGPKALQKYMKEGIVDVVSAGYYGPKGSKIASQIIQERLEKQLNHIARKNELVRDAGVGGYVQAVLVPELFVVLVKEDMKGTEKKEMSDEKAREVLNESMEFGILLNGEEEDAIDAIEDEDLDFID